MGFLSKILGIEEEVVTQKSTLQQTTPQQTTSQPKIVEYYTLGKKNFAKIMALVYPSISDRVMPSFDLFYVFDTINNRERVFAPVNGEKMAQCLYFCFNYNIDFETIDIKELENELNKRLERYFYMIGRLNGITTFCDDDFNAICTEVMIEFDAPEADTNIIVNQVYDVDTRDGYFKDISKMKERHDNINEVIDTIHASKMVIEVICNGFKITRMLQKDGDFYKAYNKLATSGVDTGVINDKLHTLFFNDFSTNFGSENEQYIKVLVSFCGVLISLESINEDFFKLNEDVFPRMTHKKLEENILEFPFVNKIKVVDHSEIREDVIQCSHYIIMYLIEQEKLDFPTLYNYYINRENQLINNITASIIKEHKEQELNRILSGDISEEVNKTEELYDFKNIKDGFEFEDYVGRLFKKLGYNVEQTKLSGDQGADLIIEKDGIKTVIQTKLYSQPVGNKAVQEVVGAIAYYEADAGAVVTNSTFTSSAIELANKNNVELIDKDVLASFIDTASKL